MNREQLRLVAALESELAENNLAVFAGAGLSSGLGFVNWKELLAPIAQDLDLDIDVEIDLVALAQYHANANQANRGKLNQLLVTEFSKRAISGPNHEILARLPISTYWTTNYDTIIESALRNAGKVPDIKYTNKQLSFTKPKRDAVVYKMHGDVEHPGDAVLTRDDYEKYHIKMQPFITALSGDLVSKTFLFLGFSFTDPNLEYILSRVRVYYGNDQRQHHCILRKVAKDAGEDDAGFEYRLRKQELFANELLRVGIKTTYVADFNEITTILSAVEDRFRNKTIFISGAAHDYGPWSSEEAQRFVYQLSMDINERGYRIVSGFGIGIGSSVITGALEKIYMRGERLDSDQLILRPFPQDHNGNRARSAIWSDYRNDMIQRAGVAIFLFGNKIVDGTVELSTGMLEEFRIAKERGVFLLPIGATGYITKNLWEEVMQDGDFTQRPHGAAIKEKMSELGNEELELDDLRLITLEILGLLTN